MIPHVNDTKSDFEDVELEYAKERTLHIKWYHQVLLNRPLKIVLALVIIAVLTPILIYQLAFYTSRRVTTTDGFSFGSCLVPRVSRLPCGLGNVTAHECHVQCCYDFSNDICFHRFPSRFSYIMDRHWAEDIVLKPRIATVPFQDKSSLTNIRLSIDEVSSTHMTITFYNSGQLSLNGNRIEDKNYNYEVSSPELNVIVNSANKTIFNTIRGPLIAAENIWEVAFKLTDETMYGFGEIPIRGEMVKVIYNNKDDMISLPLIFAKNNDTYHGLLIDTKEPTEVRFQEDNVVLIRSITNIGLKFQVFTGPKPIDVMNDARKTIGAKKDLDYWMLGAHVCGEYPETPKSTAELNNFILGAAEQNLPFESHCVMPIVFDDICDTEPAVIVNEGADILRNAGKRFIPHVSPYIRYEETEIETTDSNTTTRAEFETGTCNSTVESFKSSILQNPEGSRLYKGVVEKYNVVYPNYENISTGLIEKLWTYTESFDGVVLENSWPLDESIKFVNETKYHLPYFSEHFERAFNHTPKWNATYKNGVKHFHEHIEYGNHFASAFENIKAVPTWLSSSFMNGKVYHNKQNVATSWTNLQRELTEAALGGVSGQWFWSTPICGDMDNFDPDAHANLCVKWYMAATYLPMIKIHSKRKPRDPLAFQGTHRNLMINALKTRMSLSLYFYTTLKEGPLLRPMFYQFPESEYLKDLTSQYSVGKDLIIVPNLHPDQAMVHMRMPPGQWYELWSGLKLEGEEGDAVTMATTDADFFTAVRGGSIITLQKDFKLTAEETRSQSNISLTIALNCENNTKENYTECFSSGSLYIVENTSIKFEANDTLLTITATGDLNPLCDDTKPILTLIIDELNIYGLNDTLNNYDHHKHIDTAIDLCELTAKQELVFYFMSL